MSCCLFDHLTHLSVIAPRSRRKPISRRARGARGENVTLPPSFRAAHERRRGTASRSSLREIVFSAASACVLLSAMTVHAAPARAPLADATEKMDRAAIRALLKQHAAVNTPQADGMTALHWAAYQDDVE